MKIIQQRKKKLSKILKLISDFIVKLRDSIDARFTPEHEKLEMFSFLAPYNFPRSLTRVENYGVSSIEKIIDHYQLENEALRTIPVAAEELKKEVQQFMIYSYKWSKTNIFSRKLLMTCRLPLFRNISNMPASYPNLATLLELVDVAVIW